MAETRAEKVRWLFATIPDPETGELFSIPRAAAKMRELGFDLSDNTLRNVYSGEVERPSYEVLEGIAKLFGVSPAFFSSDASIQDLEQQLAAAALLKDARILNLAQRAVGVVPEGVEGALAILEHYRAKQGLDRQDGQDGRDGSGAPTTLDGEPSQALPSISHQPATRARRRQRGTGQHNG